MSDEVHVEGNRVWSGNTRVSVVSPRILRIEYAEDAAFEDRPTLLAQERVDASVEFDVTDGGAAGGFVVDTGPVRLSVNRPDSTPTRNSVTALLGEAADPRWWFGKKDRGNLGGTRRTLDGWKGDKRQKVTLEDGRLRFGRWRRQHLDPGLLSRDGWVVVDDAGSPVLDPEGSPGGSWPVGRDDRHVVDQYLVVGGDDHVGILQEARALIGEAPLLPRAALGYWYSRYFAYTDRELEALVDRFDERDLPLDVVVIDMDWHLPEWTGYSWDRRYFPDPERTLRRLHDRGLLVTLNLHPADGVGAHEDAFHQMCEDLGLDPDETDRIPFDCSDPAFVGSYFRRLHHPQEDIGVDFWWMDWQQGKQSGVPGLDPLPWLNKLHWDDRADRRPRRRPLSFSRWGGLGSGRYPVGFSGDTYTTWDSLAYQPEFTATAANVGYGWWSHDIGGHYGPPTTPELMTRWVQFGVYSPILRTHGSKDMDQERRVWEFPSPYREQMRDDIRRRYELIPYVYRAARRGVEDGRSLVRPMYHEHPTVDAAYDHPGQYWFGEDLVVSPVLAPVGEDEEAEVTTWLPPGEWYELSRGETHWSTGPDGCEVTRSYRLEETPVFARAGTVIPGQRDARRAGTPFHPDPVFTVVPRFDDESGGAGELYEDDGVSEAWRRGSSVTTPVRWSRTGDTTELVVGPAEGRYKGWRGSRNLEVRFLGTAPPRGVRVGRRTLDWHDDAVADGWWWDAATAATVIRLSKVDLRERTRIRLDHLQDRADGRTDGLPGLRRRLDRIAELCGLASPHLPLHPDERLGVDLGQALHRVALDPGRFEAELDRLDTEVPGLAPVLEEFAAAWRASFALEFMDAREASAELIEQAGRVLARIRR